MNENHPLFPITPYAASKVAGDHIALSYWQTFGLDISIIRPFNTFGPRQNDETYAGVIPVVIKRALHGNPVIINGDGEQTRDYVFVGDVIDAAVRIYEESSARGKPINIASGKEISINELVRKILFSLDINVPILHEAPRIGDVRRLCGDIHLARQLIGFEPTIGLDEGLAKTISWYKEIFSEKWSCAGGQ